MASKNNNNNFLEWPIQSLDLYPIGMPWCDLKEATHTQKPSSVPELKQFCKEERAKIPLQ